MSEQKKLSVFDELRAQQQAFTDASLQPDEFYMEGEFLVFTTAYHLRRGYCCNSDCRHCPYK